MSIKDELGALLNNGTKAKSGIDSATIRELAELLTETGLTEIEVEQDGMRLRVARKAGAVVSYAPPPAPMAHPSSAPPAAPTSEPDAKHEGPHPGAVPSPMVGTVYLSPEPGVPAFVKVGDMVKEGQTLLIVEAMKTMNPIAAPRAGTVAEICIGDAQPVEFGQTLLILS